MTDADRERRFTDEALRWLPHVARYAMSLAREQADADDLVQETFLRAWRSWDQFTAGSECRGWLFTICRNQFLRTQDREARYEPHDEAELEALGAAALHSSAAQDGLQQLFSRLDLGPALDRAVTALPEPFREAVLLVDVQDLSYAEASKVLGVPTGTVRSRLFRGRRLLQEALINYARDAGYSRAGGGSPTMEPSA